MGARILNTLAVVAATVMSLMVASSARAEADLFSRGTVSGIMDLRLGAADGETAWIDGGLGKARFGGGGKLALGEASIVWNPHLSSHLGAVIVAQSQQGQDRIFDAGEAYLTWRGDVAGSVRLGGRAGLMYPPISLEHDGLEWSVPDTITPSAINSWVAEETKVVAVEATARGVIGGQSLTATVGVFTHGDTAGTLLAFRGWALHDLKSSASGDFPLPPLSPFMVRRQAPFTTSVRELDGRAGVYGRVEWRASSKLALDLFAYDNDGDRTSVDNREWSWETRFFNLGARFDPDDRTHLRAQALQGETLMGYSNARGVWIDVGFQAAYLSVTRDLGPGALTARLDQFSTSDRTNKAVDNNAEHGWAALAAYRWDVRPDLHLVFEAMRIDSDRPERVRLGETPRQTQTVVQTALRYLF
jgi:hypothetical protein